MLQKLIQVLIKGSGNLGQCISINTFATFCIHFVTVGFFLNFSIKLEGSSRVAVKASAQERSCLHLYC